MSLLSEANQVTSFPHVRPLDSVNTMYGTVTISKSSVAAHQQVGAVNTAQCAPQRTLFNIVWFCLSTVLLCAWISVHPNTYQGSKWRALWGRLRLMVWTIIAPELILAWAVRQWFGAWTIRDRYTDPNSMSRNTSVTSFADSRQRNLANQVVLTDGLQNQKSNQNTKVEKVMNPFFSPNSQLFMTIMQDHRENGRCPMAIY